MRVFHVYSKVDCDYCKKAISLLNKKKESFTVVVLDHAPVVLQEMKEAYGWETVPIIILNRDFENNPAEIEIIGGSTELEEFFKDEERQQNEKENTNQASEQETASNDKDKNSGEERDTDNGAE